MEVKHFLPSRLHFSRQEINHEKAPGGCFGCSELWLRRTEVLMLASHVEWLPSWQQWSPASREKMHVNGWLWLVPKRREKRTSCKQHAWECAISASLRESYISGSSGALGLLNYFTHKVVIATATTNISKGEFLFLTLSSNHFFFFFYFHPLSTHAFSTHKHFICNHGSASTL